MIRAFYKPYVLHFKQPSGTSRGILKSKKTYFVKLIYNDKVGIGECALFEGLSVDDKPDYESKLQWTCDNIQKGKEFIINSLVEYPSIQFGIEQAFLSLKSKNSFELFPSNFSLGKEGITINGLIWMGSKTFMLQQIDEKLKSGFTTIKLKIGAIDFKTEIKLLKYIRNRYSANEVELRVDANGAFSPYNALEKLKRLADLQIHSIEQPIKANQRYEMAELCKKTPLPIALDEEIIGVFNNKEELLMDINPQYIILKPSLIGGFKATEDWIKLAKKNKIGWWITSALESNIGLNAIAQFTYKLKSKMPQGLGTGSLFTNNFTSPLNIKKGTIWYDYNKLWKFNFDKI